MDAGLDGIAAAGETREEPFQLPFWVIALLSVCASIAACALIGTSAAVSPIAVKKCKLAAGYIRAKGFRSRLVGFWIAVRLPPSGLRPRLVRRSLSQASRPLRRR